MCLRTIYVSVRLWAETCQTVKNGNSFWSDKKIQYISIYTFRIVSRLSRRFGGIFEKFDPGL